MPSFNWKRAVAVGFGIVTTSILWPIFNTYVPILLQSGNPLWEASKSTESQQGIPFVGFGLAPGLAFFIMTWDNILHGLLTPWAGARSDNTWTRWGRRKPWLLVGMPIAMLGFLLIPFAVTLPLLIVFIVLTNLGTGIYRAPVLAWLGDMFPSADRSKASGVNNVMRGFAGVLTLVGSGLLFARFGMAAPFLWGACLLAFATIVALILVKEPRKSYLPHEDAVKDSANHKQILRYMRDIWQTENRDRRYVLLSVLCGFAAFNALETGHSSFAVFELGLTPGQASLFASVFALMFILGSLPSGWLATYIGRRRIMELGAAIFVLASLGGAIFIRTQMGYIIVLGLCGIAASLTLIHTLPLLLDTSNDDEMGAITGLFLLTWQGASILGPVLAGYAIQLLAMQRIFFVIVSAFMMLMWLALQQVATEGPVSSIEEEPILTAR